MVVNFRSCTFLQCSWILNIRVSDNGPAAKQLWTLVSLDVVIDDCAVDEVVHAASQRQTQLPISDWHVFVVAVAIAACVVVVGCLLTVVVALRQCSRRRRRCKTTTTTTTAPGCDGLHGDQGELMLKLVPSPTQSSDVSSDVSSSLTDHVVLVMDQLLNSHHHQPVNDITLIRAALEQANRHHIQAPASLQVSAHACLEKNHQVFYKAKPGWYLLHFWVFWG